MTIVINDDPELVAEATAAVEANGGYCPCALVKNEDTKCMCKEFRESNELGICPCGRFKRIMEEE